jgi:hypothetical protein
MDTTPGSRDPLRAVAAWGLPGTGLPAPAEPLGTEAWAAFAAAVGRERLSGLLAVALETGFPATPAQQAQVVAFESQVTARCLRLDALLLRSEALLADAGLPVRVLKGCAVAHLDYPDPRLRPYVDVDLLVRGPDFDRAVEVLAGAGLPRVYPQPRPGFDRRFGKGASFRAPDDATVDLHRTFVMGPYGLQVHLADLWTDPQPFVLSGRELLAMSAEARLLHACYHATLGDWPPRLVPRRDIAQLILLGAVDERRVRELAAEWRGEALLALGLVRTWNAFALTPDPPLVAWARGFSVPRRDRRLLAVYSGHRNTYAAKSLAALVSIPRLSDKAAYLRALLLPDRSYLHGRHDGRFQRLRHGLGQASRRSRATGDTPTKTQGPEI